MRLNLLVFLIIYSLTVLGQGTEIQWESGLISRCQIDSITIQSLVSNTVVTKSITDRFSLANPTDLVVFILKKRDGNQIVIGPKYVEGAEMKFYLDQTEDCQKISISSFFDSRLDEYEQFEKKRSEQTPDLILERIIANSNSVFVGKYLQFYLSSDLMNASTSKEIVSLFKQNNVQKRIGENFLVQPFLAQIEQTIKEKTINLSDYDLIAYNPEQGKENVSPNFYLYDFWFINCVPCLRDHQIIIEDIELDRISKDLMFIGICSTASTVEEWNDYLSKEHLPWKNYHVGSTGTEMLKEYGVIYYPTYILTDNTGKILKIANKYSEISLFLKD